jgi:hypothetical protein
LAVLAIVRETFPSVRCTSMCATEPVEIFDPTVVRLPLIVREQEQIDVLRFLIRVSRLL